MPRFVQVVDSDTKVAWSDSERSSQDQVCQRGIRTRSHRVVEVIGYGALGPGATSACTTDIIVYRIQSYLRESQDVERSHYFSAFFISCYAKGQCWCTLAIVSLNTCLFHLVQISCLDARNPLSERLLNLFHLQPSLLVMHKVYRNTLPPESTRTT